MESSHCNIFFLISVLNMRLDIIKNESGKARSIERVPLLFKYDGIKIYSYQTAEAFNKFLLTVVIIYYYYLFSLPQNHYR